MLSHCGAVDGIRNYLFQGCLLGPNRHLEYRGLMKEMCEQVHTNIVVFGLHKTCPLTAKDFIIALQQREVHVIPFRYPATAACRAKFSVNQQL